MAITVAQLAVHLRLLTDPGQALTEPHLTVITQLHTWAAGVADNRALGAPDAARDESIILLAGYLYDKPPAARGAGYSNSWENSGAANVLRPWTRRRGVLLEGAPVAADPGAAPSGGVSGGGGVPAPGGLTRQQIEGLIERAVASLPAPGLDARQVQALVDQAIARLPAGGLDAQQVQALIDQAIAQIQFPAPGLDAEQVQQIVDQAIAQIQFPAPGPEPATWATAASDDLIPADKYRAPTSTDRGAPRGVTNDDVDQDAGAGFLAWSINHLRRLLARIVPSWVTDAGALVPKSKLPAPSRALPLGAALPAPPRAMRIGWNQSATMPASVFIRANLHPLDGVSVGDTSGLDVPPAPPAVASDPTLYLGIWIAGVAVAGTSIRDGGELSDTFRSGGALTVDGVGGHYYVSTTRLRHDTTRRVTLTLPGDEVLSTSGVESWALTANPTELVPASKLRGGTVLLGEYAFDGRKPQAQRFQPTGIVDPRSANDWLIVSCRDSSGTGTDAVRRSATSWVVASTIPNRTTAQTLGVGTTEIIAGGQPRGSIGAGAGLLGNDAYLVVNQDNELMAATIITQTGPTGGRAFEVRGTYQFWGVNF